MNVQAHLCSGLDCSTCIEAERQAATQRLESWKKDRVKKFTAPRQKRSAVFSAKRLEERAADYNNGFLAGRHDATTPPVPPQSEPANTMTLDDMTGRFADAKTALAFIMAGNAYFTARSEVSGTRYTFRVNRANCSRCGKPNCREVACMSQPTYFVALLSGPDNNSDYSYMGMIRDNCFRLTRASKMREDAVPVRAFKYVFERLQRSEMPAACELWHEGRCGRCGRRLTVPASIAAGIGPDCASQML